jgi:hypothetical protein
MEATVGMNVISLFGRKNELVENNLYLQILVE